MGASAEEGRDDRSTQCKKEVKKNMDKRNKALLLGTMLAALLVVGSAMAMAYTEDPTGPLPVKTVKLSDLKMDIVEVTRDTAESESTTINVDFENKTIYADGVQYELAEIHKVDVDEKGIIGCIPISGYVSGGYTDLWGIGYLHKCCWVQVCIAHDPKNADVLLGVVNSAGVGEGIIDTDHNGVACYQYHIPADDYYYAVVGAPTSTGFSYKGCACWSCCE